MARYRPKRGHEGHGPQGGPGYTGPWANLVNPPPNQNYTPGGGQGGGGQNGGGGQGGGGQGGGGGGQGGNPGGLAFDAGLERFLSGIQQEGDSATALATQQRQGLFSQNFDPNNPFNNQAMLNRQLQQAHAENALGMGSSGHLYSGALEAVDANTAFEGQRAQDQLLRDYAGKMGTIDTDLASTISGLSGKGEGAIWDFAQAMANDVASSRPEAKRKHKKKKK